jgi:hypothetical protein
MHNNEDKKLRRGLFPDGSDTSSLFDALREAYLALPDENYHTSQYINLLQRPELEPFKNQLHILTQLDTVSTYASSQLSRRGSFDSYTSGSSSQSSSYRNPSVSIPSYLTIASAGFISGITGGLRTYPEERNSRTFNVLEGLCVGLLATGSSHIFHSAPLVGQSASYAVVLLAARSRILRLPCSPSRQERYFKTTIAGSIGSMVGVQTARIVTQQTDSQMVRLTTSIALSILGSFIAHKITN